METEEEMFEEHLEEYQNGEIDKEFSEFRTKIWKLEKRRSDAKHDQQLQDNLEKAITLLKLHLQNYQRIVIFNRRRARQRLRKRQCTLRNFFLQSLMEMQIRFVEILPLVLELQAHLGYTLCNVEDINKSSPRERMLSESDMEEDGAASLGFYKDVVANFTNEQWLDTFHMPKHIFNLICSRLKTSLDNVDMHFESWIAMCIYTMATGSKFSSVGMLFNVEKKFVRQSLLKFVNSLISEFSENQLCMPKTKEELEKISKGFQKATNMTACVAGILSIFEIPNICDCGRYKTCGTERIIVQVCIDDRLLFRRVEIANHKPSLFLRSPNEISTIWKKFSEKCVVPYFVVAPHRYPLRTWLMQKYDCPRETWEYNFNKSFDNLNIFRDVSLKCLFGRWQILSCTECIVPDLKGLIVKACCVLHNLLEESGEFFSEEWGANFNFSKYEYKINAAVTRCFNDSESAIEKRNIIAKLICKSGIQNMD